MKVIPETVSVVEVANEGLISLINKNVTLFCASYIYAGKLIGVNDECIKLSGAKIVYETGALNTKDWTDAQTLPNDWYIQKGLIESFGILK